jgi:hypothetical protein
MTKKLCFKKTAKKFLFSEKKACYLRLFHLHFTKKVFMVCRNVVLAPHEHCECYTLNYAFTLQELCFRKWIKEK